MEVSQIFLLGTLPSAALEPSTWQLLELESLVNRKNPISLPKFNVVVRRKPTLHPKFSKKLAQKHALPYKKCKFDVPTSAKDAKTHTICGISVDKCEQKVCRLRRLTIKKKERSFFFSLTVRLDSRDRYTNTTKTSLQVKENRLSLTWTEQILKYKFTFSIPLLTNKQPSVAVVRRRRRFFFNFFLFYFKWKYQKKCRKSLEKKKKKCCWLL